MGDKSEKTGDNSEKKLGDGSEEKTRDGSEGRGRGNQDMTGGAKWEPVLYRLRGNSVKREGMETKGGKRV